MSKAATVTKRRADVELVTASDNRGALFVCSNRQRAETQVYIFTLQVPIEKFTSLILYSQPCLKKYTVAVKTKPHLPLLALLSDEFEIKPWSLHHF